MNIKFIYLISQNPIKYLFAIFAISKYFPTFTFKYSIYPLKLFIDISNIIFAFLLIFIIISFNKYICKVSKNQFEYLNIRVNAILLNLE